MKSKKTRFYRILPTLILGGIFVLSGCEKSNDLYNPDHLQEEAKKAFPVKNIDPNQTWETSTICNASVTINEKTGGTYTIKVYTENPYNTDGNAYLLAKTSVANGQTANFKFDIPATLQYVYVMKVNSEGYSSAVPVAVENGSMKATFGETGITRVTQTNANSRFFVPETPSDKTFPTIAPNNCGDISKYKDEENKIPYLLKDNTYEKINPEKGGDLYIQGNVTIKDWSEPGYVTNFYLLPNATLTLTMKKFNHRPNSIFSIGNNAQLIAINTDIQIEKDSKVFNKGIIKTKLFQVTLGYLYNANKIEATKVLLTNGTSYYCNATDGELIVSELEVQGDGHFINETNAIVKNSGATIVNCTNGSWENAGNFTTKTMNISAWNQNIKNACRLKVEGKLTFQEAGILNESYIECADLEMQNSIVDMAANSFFNVKNEATFQDNWENDNSQGFIASASNGWALLKMGKAISKNNHNYKDIVYIGKLYIACNNHFAIGDQYNPTYKLEGGAKFVGADNADIVIEKSTCNPGYNSTPDGGGENNKVIEYAYAFEDMMLEAGDYDFNDVVLYVTAPFINEGGERVIEVTLKAAGATKKLAVLFNNGTTTTTLFGNVHTSLNVPEGTIVNTGDATGTPSTITIKVGDNFNLTNNGDLYISDGKRDVHIPNFTTSFKAGDVPYALRVACADWKWPKERIQITEAYSGFEDWAKDATQTADWYNNPNSNKVIGIE